jgi:hypothetical protein
LLFFLLLLLLLLWQRRLVRLFARYRSSVAIQRMFGCRALFRHRRRPLCLLR